MSDLHFFEVFGIDVISSKGDAEIKLLIGCSAEDIQIIPEFHNEMYTQYIPNLWWKMTFPTDFLDLLKEETKALLYLETIMPDGSPQVTPIWFNTDGDYILINTNEGRVKDKNMKARPRVALTIQDPNNQDQYLGIRGEVVEFTREGADEHINRLSLKYYNKPWTYEEGQRRIIYKIKPIHFDLHYD